VVGSRAAFSFMMIQHAGRKGVASGKNGRGRYCGEWRRGSRRQQDPNSVGRCVWHRSQRASGPRLVAGEGRGLVYGPCGGG
jgi:hypothetical protein